MGLNMYKQGRHAPRFQHHVDTNKSDDNDITTTTKTDGVWV